MVSGAYDDQTKEDTTKQQATINLPMLLTAHTTRKRLQGRLGDEFVDTYESGAAGGLRAKRGSQTLGPSDHILTAGDDAIDLEYFKDAVHIMEPEKEYTEASLKQSSTRSPRNGFALSIAAFTPAVCYLTECAKGPLVPSRSSCAWTRTVPEEFHKQIGVECCDRCNSVRKTASQSRTPTRCL